MALCFVYDAKTTKHLLRQDQNKNKMNKYHKSLAKLNSQWQTESSKYTTVTQGPHHLPASCLRSSSTVVPKLRDLSKKFYSHNLDNFDTWVARDTARQVRHVDLQSCSVEELRKFWRNFPAFPSAKQAAFSKQIIKLCEKIIYQCPCSRCQS